MELLEPGVTFKDSYLEALEEFQKEGRHLDKDVAQLKKNFPQFIEKIKEEKFGKNLPPGRVPQSTYWLVDQGKFIGEVRIRHSLNENLLRLGGHIGYEIRPSERRKGYGKEILRLSFPYARHLGIYKALLTCDSTNVASRKIIESNGGVLENEVAGKIGNPTKLRYWIDLTEVFIEDDKV